MSIEPKTHAPRILAALAVTLLLLLAGVFGSLASMSATPPTGASASAPPRGEACACAPGCDCPCCVSTDDAGCDGCFQRSSAGSLTVHTPPRAFPQALPCTRATVPLQPRRRPLEAVATSPSDAHPARLLRPPRPSLAA